MRVKPDVRFRRGIIFLDKILLVSLLTQFYQFFVCLVIAKMILDHSEFTSARAVLSGHS